MATRLNALIVSPGLPPRSFACWSSARILPRSIPPSKRVDISSQPRAAFLRLHPHDGRVGSRGSLAEERVGQLAELDGDLGEALGQPLAAAQVEGHAVPAPAVHVQLDGGESRRARTFRHVLLLPVP